MLRLRDLHSCDRPVPRYGYWNFALPMRLTSLTRIALCFPLMLGLPLFSACTSSSSISTPAKVAVAEPTNDPNVTVTVNRYPIQGMTAADLRRDLNATGPLDEKTNRRFDGYTRWWVRWRYWYTNQADGCRIDRAEVKTEVTITLPEWNAPLGASSELKQRWQRYITALETHENGHKQNGLDASRDILAKLKDFPAYSTCDQVGLAANEAAHAIIREYNEKDITYDRVTNHGATEGARFP